jgi:hypothetical protein
LGSKRVADVSSAGTKHGRAVEIEEIAIADDPSSWEALGFTVRDGTVLLACIRLALVGRGAGQGILGWSLRGIANEDLDGLPTVESTSAPAPPTTAASALASPGGSPPAAAQHADPLNSISPPTAEHADRRSSIPPPAAEHANGVSAIDHVVAISSQLERTVGALRTAGLDLRRIREQPTPAGAPRQAFFRLGAVVLEVVQEPDELVEQRSDTDCPARFWGLALLSGDLERTVERFGDHASEIRAAVQPGRRIATVRRSAGLTLPIALMSRAERPLEV